MSLQINQKYDNQGYASFDKLIISVRIGSAKKMIKNTLRRADHVLERVYNKNFQKLQKVPSHFEVPTWRRFGIIISKKEIG
jgi:hypothetical protein